LGGVQGRLAGGGDIQTKTGRASCQEKQTVGLKAQRPEGMVWFKDTGQGQEGWGTDKWAERMLKVTTHTRGPWWLKN
jgi:hypothetical protein